MDQATGEFVITVGKQERFDLGKDGSVTCRVSENLKRLQIELDLDERGLTKSGVNGLIDFVKRMREAMLR
jgi:hypothetical protein